MAEGASDPRAVLARHGRSFHWAARLLPREAADDAAELYAFCRHVDDLSDRACDADAARARLTVLRAGIAAGLPVDAEAGRFLALAERRGIARGPALHLIDGAIADLSGPRLGTVGELVIYGYRMAGTVGQMMCPLLGVRHRAAEPFAIDLGIAMQLTNIARDVAEDAAMGRRYLPADLLGCDPEPAELADPDPDPELAERAWGAVQGVLGMAEGYYRSADRGMAFLPARPRLAILAASRVYEGIGGAVMRAGPRRFRSRRAAVGRVGKAWHTLRAAGAFLTGLNRPPKPHDPALHAPLAALRARPAGRSAA
jgi:phytoene synthase